MLEERIAVQRVEPSGAGWPPGPWPGRSLDDPTEIARVKGDRDEEEIA